jgi:adenylate kinase
VRSAFAVGPNGSALHPSPPERQWNAGRRAPQTGVPHISTGEILRAEVAQGSDLGRRAKHVMDRGELVTDDLMLDLVQSRLHQRDCRRGFILDGFPRSLGQALGFETTCGYDPSSLKVLSLEVPQEELVQRLADRKRDDDREEVIRQRLAVYRAQTEPLRDFYRERKALIEIDGMGSMDDVFRRLLAQVGSAR